MMTSEPPHGALPEDHGERIERVRLSLEGLSVGDAFGECFFSAQAELLISHRTLPRAPWRYTDDTAMALSIVDTLAHHGRIDCDALARRLAEQYRDDPGRGYGAMAHTILSEIGQGIPWQEATGKAFGGQGSMGNGGAMRVGPVGAYFADDLDAVVQSARDSARVTHAHPDGQAGAIAAAVAAAQAWRTRFAPPSQSASAILETALEHTPDGKTREGLLAASRLPLTEPVHTAATALGNGSLVVSFDTVPFALWCAARHLASYEEALWTTVSGLGDRDTTCAIVGSIVALAVGRRGIPEAWLNARERLPS
jgi:ADP-ribosylglycohydrolase